MKKICVVLALAGLFVMSTTVHGQFADSVLSYESGTGFAAGYTNVSAAVGGPAPGSSVTPYAPPFSKSQLVSIGAGGEITLQMDSPILNTPANPYGLDFIIFANSFFVVNGGSGQSATTSGSVFFHQNTTVIQVSQDGVNWYTLNPALAPMPGEWFPAYGAGNPVLPMDPSLMNSADFAGLTLTQVESLYNGSAGGTGYSLSWAQDSSGNSVDLASADYIRIEVQSGVLDMDAVSVVPEPATWAMVMVGTGMFFYGRKAAQRASSGLKPSPHPDPLPSHGMGAEREQQSNANRKLIGLTEATESRYCKGTKIMRILSLILFCLLAVSSARAMTLTENFTNNPALDGWRVYGDTNFFRWDSTNNEMDVTWDSLQTNSYFYLPLCRTLTRTDDFSLSFDLKLDRATASGFSSELAIGLFNLPEATSPDFQRSTGVSSPDVVEFDYFPDSGFGATVWPLFVDSESLFNYNNTNDYAIYAPNLNDWYHVAMTYRATSQTMVTTMTNFEQTTGITIVDPIMQGFKDFRVNTFSISSYQDDGMGDSIYATGAVRNISITLPPASIAGPVVESESFTSDPYQDGWQTYGDTNLFTWDSTNDVMNVTWNSTNVNSYIYRPLGTTLRRDDDFTMAFDLNLSKAKAIGFGSELALGLFNLSEATNSDFQRSTGVSSPDLVEFDYFPDAGFGDTIWPLFVDTNSLFNYNNTNDYAIYAPNLNDWYHVVMAYSASNQTMVTTMTNFERTSGVSITDPLMPTFTDFRVNAFSMSSYQDDGMGDSDSARGNASNVVLTLPPVVRHLAATYSNGVSQVQFVTYVNWDYMLERSTNLASWQMISPCVTGTGDPLTLCDTNPPGDKAFYRVVAGQP
jgi:hypothetical protein